jgi:predicted O-linked N-acetylglucosamine transferase (SPINDLY family)
MPDYSSHLAMYNRVDVALDPFPYNGTTTTIEALLMGVAVIALEGNSHRSRVSGALLHSVGLSSFCTSSEESYRKLAAHLASNHNKIKTLRRSLRNAVLQSPLCDARRLTANIENVYRIFTA